MLLYHHFYYLLRVLLWLARNQKSWIDSYAYISWNKEQRRDRQYINFLYSLIEMFDSLHLTKIHTKYFFLPRKAT